MLHIYIKDNIE